MIPAAIVVALLAYFGYRHFRPAPLTEKDTILIADFVNTTGEEIFDGTLRDGLKVKLEESPFLNIFSDERIRETLKTMERPPDARITNEIGREICLRNGLKAMVSGSISAMGHNYAITLQAVNAESGDAISRDQIEAGSRERIISALGDAAIHLREKLGESIRSIEKFDVSLETATTSNLEALKAFSTGMKRLHKLDGSQEGIALIERAVELDPNFAMAHAVLGRIYDGMLRDDLSVLYAGKAFELRDRVSEFERYYISTYFHRNVTGDLEAAIKEALLWKEAYPRSSDPLISLSFLYIGVGRYEKATEAAREAIQLNPDISDGYAALAWAYFYLGQYDEAKEILNRAIGKGLDNIHFYLIPYHIGFITGDQHLMQRQSERLKGTPTEPNLVVSQAAIHAASGRLEESNELYGRVGEMRHRGGSKVFPSVMAAYFGKCRDIRKDILARKNGFRDLHNLAQACTSLSACGHFDLVQSLIDKATEQYPKHTILNEQYRPIVLADMEIRRGNPAKAVELLKPALRYEKAEYGVMAPYNRGRAYLLLGDGEKAAAEFQKILDGSQLANFAPIRSLARLGLARAAKLTGDIAKSKKEYQDFLAIMKDADDDLPVVNEAKEEYKKLISAETVR